MIKFKLDHYYHPYELREYWFWYIDTPEINGPTYTRKSDCKRGLLRFIKHIRHHKFEIEEVKE